MSVEGLVRPGFKIDRADNRRILRLAGEHGFTPWRIERMALDALEEKMSVAPSPPGVATAGAARSPLRAAREPVPLGEVRAGEFEAGAGVLARHRDDSDGTSPAGGVVDALPAGIDRPGLLEDRAASGPAVSSAAGRRAPEQDR